VAKVQVQTVLKPLPQLELQMQQSGQSTLCEDGIELQDQEKASLTQTGFFSGAVMSVCKEDPFSPHANKT